MNKLQIAQMAFLMGTAQHYNMTNRGVYPNDPARCSYEHGCAVGRHVANKQLCAELDKMGSTAVTNRELFVKLPDDLKALGRDFLAVVQSLHDEPKHWNEQGLTQLGEIRVRTIAQEVLSGIYLA